jgi:hypothetical protein
VALPYILTRPSQSVLQPRMPCVGVLAGLAGLGGPSLACFLVRELRGVTNLGCDSLDETRLCAGHCTRYACFD